MRINKFISVVGLITLFSLLYVYQQTEIFLLAYEGQKKLTAMEELSGKNGFLKYNVEKNSSLVYIGNKISDYADFQMPDNYRLVKSVFSRGVLGVAKRTPPPENFLSRIFSVKRQAEAKTIGPSANQALQR